MLRILQIFTLCLHTISVISYVGNTTFFDADSAEITLVDLPDKTCSTKLGKTGDTQINLYKLFIGKLVFIFYIAKIYLTNFIL
jgi:hypothetical protein